MQIKYAALILVAINIIVFAIQASVSGFTESFLLQSFDITARPWILISSIFLHGSLAHILGNMFALGLFGLILEHNIGSKRFLTIYFASGLVTSIVSAFFYPSSLGASGAIFGVIGVLAALRPKMVVWTYGVPMPMFVAAGFWLFLDVLGAFYPTNVANIAHISGLIFGVLIGLVIRKPEILKDSKKEKILDDENFQRWEDEWM